MQEPMEPANTPGKSTENIKNTCQIKMYVVEFIQPRKITRKEIKIAARTEIATTMYVGCRVLSSHER